MARKVRNTLPPLTESDIACGATGFETAVVAIVGAVLAEAAGAAVAFELRAVFPFFDLGRPAEVDAASLRVFMIFEKPR